MTIPINQAKGFAIAQDLQQVIIFGYDGKETHVVTWGDSDERSAQAAAGANHIKKLWGWPEDTIVDSAKVVAIKDENERLKIQVVNLFDRIKALELAASTAARLVPTVHVIEGTEYEAGWGQRPDGFIAFLSKEDAELFIKDWNKNHNSAKHAPAVYVAYRYIGIRECSENFFDKIQNSPQKAFHLYMTAELKA